MSHPRRAVVEIVTVQIACPNKRCGAGLAARRSGSYIWDLSDLPGDELLTCSECGQELILPRTVKLENGLGA